MVVLLKEIVEQLTMLIGFGLMHSAILVQTQHLYSIIGVKKSNTLSFGNILASSKPNSKKLFIKRKINEAQQTRFKSLM